MSWSVPLTSSTCIQASCGWIPCQELIWSIHSAFAIATVVGSTLASTMARSLRNKKKGLSEHMIWMIQNFYRNQQGQVVGSNGCSRSFLTHGGIRQGCAFSPRLFRLVLDMLMANWRDEMRHLGLDLRDGGRSVLDSRFADDI